MRIGDTVYLEKPYRGYRCGELVEYHHPYWTVRLESGLEIECYEDEFKINADLGMGADGANTVYMFNDKKVKAASKIDKELQDRLKSPTTKDSGAAQKIKDMAERVKLSDDVAKSIANVYDGLDGLGKDALKRYLQNLSFPITNQVATLLGQMIEEVPLETYRDIKDVGFLSDAAKGGNSDDLFALKAACGLRQAGKDISELFDNGQFKSREEIEEAVSMAIGEYKKERKGKNFYDDPKKQDMMNALREMHHSDKAIVRAIEEVYESTANEDANFANVTKYLRENNAPKAKLLRYADKADRDKYFKEHGIKPQKADSSHSVCSIGFSEKEQKWYGWSHRAMYGFGIGHKVKEGDCGADGWAEGQKGIKPGFVCETIEDCEKVARAFAKAVSSSVREKQHPISAAGYDGYSMSNNARQAYSEGEKPKSKWTKKAVIDFIAEEEGVDPSEIELLNHWSTYLRKSSWHHTSKYYNRTEFYTVDYDDEDIRLSEEATKKKQEKEKKAFLLRISKIEEEISWLERANPYKDVTITEKEEKVILEFPSEYKSLQGCGFVSWSAPKMILVNKKYVEVNLNRIEKEIRRLLEANKERLKKMKEEL